MMRTRFGAALLGLLLVLLVAAGVDASTRGAHQLWRHLEAENAKRVQREQSGAPVEAQAAHEAGAEHRELNFFTADPVECKKFCNRNYDDTIGYKCSVRPLANNWLSLISPTLSSAQQDPTPPHETGDWRAQQACSLLQHGSEHSADVPRQLRPRVGML